MLNKQELYNIIDFVVEKSKGYDTRVLINSQAESLIRYANSMIHQNVFEDVTNVSITVIDGKKRSEQSTTDYSHEGLESAVSEAIANLEFLPNSGQQPAPVTEPVLIEEDSYNKKLAESYTVFSRAKELKEALDTLPETYLAYGTYVYSDMQLVYGNSQGVKRFVRGNKINYTILVADKNGGSSFIDESHQNPTNIDFKKSFARVYEKAKLNVNSKQIEPGAYTVILEPAAVADIISYLSYTSFTAKSVQNQMSFLTGKLNTKVFDERISIIDDWQNENTMSMPFDFEGYPRKKLNIIENGVAKDLSHDTLSALNEGAETTGHSVNMPSYGGIAINIVMAGGEKCLDDIIKQSDKAILVTRFHYMNVVNPRTAQLTGLTRDGVFEIKNGKIVSAIKNMRFTESMLDAFNNIAEISSDRKGVPAFFGNIFVPALKINNYHFTGKTN